jgi:pyrroline-5-carboxylate reductase
MAEVRREPGLKIGIIGLGRIGQLLAKFLMRYGDVYPDELFLVSINDDHLRISNISLFFFSNSQVDKLIY